MRRFTVISTKQYKKDFKRLLKAGADRRKIEAIIDRLSSDAPLPDRCHDHALHGSLAGTRECHIAPDWLLLYARDDSAFVLLLIRTGDHRRVLGIE
ncbi:MAG: type II toxin-antitoxin system YafQ family toxin [Candidatus Peribacteraceae bacterium]|nr:type II toxin-antitoxin system YafQ family toxin [Candidatus Peribacteraceae bacterium]